MKEEMKKYPSECTTIIVGSQLMEDGSMIAARSEDWDAMVAKNLEILRRPTTGLRSLWQRKRPLGVHCLSIALVTRPFRLTTFMESGVAQDLIVPVWG